MVAFANCLYNKQQNIDIETNMQNFQLYLTHQFQRFFIERFSQFLIYGIYVFNIYVSRYCAPLGS